MNVLAKYNFKGFYLVSQCQLRVLKNRYSAPLFRERYPRVILEESRMVVGSSSFITAGAALAHIDLALWLVRRSSPALAAMTARYLVIDPRPSQAIFMIPDHLIHTDPLVERFEQWARHRLTDGFSLNAAANATGNALVCK